MKSLLRLSMCLAIAALTALSFAGCGKKTSDQLTIGISIPSADHGWTGGVVWWAEQAKKNWEAKDPGIKVIVSTAKDASEQVDKVENLMVQGIDALVILPHDPSPLTGICEQAAKAGVYLVVVDRGLDKPVQNLYLAGDNAGFGRGGAESVVKALAGTGKILVMEGIPCTVNSIRVDAFNEVIKQHPGIEILESQSAYWDTEKGLKLMENYLQKYPQIDAVWTGDDDVLLGALKAYEESGRKDIKCFVGGAGSKAIVKRILDGDPLIPFNVTYPPKMIADGVDYAIKGLRGELADDEKTIIIPAEIITRDNARDFYYPDSIF
ncbi:ABC transporter substrate-binding protein [Oligosphaera ethanolica]|uniref:Ribose transport system substrate-binding protein n=1 Tax=Oligosphaera ethanolica TaxID=760260 RepID=A0AAE4AQR1_9BACT|nr:ABC transporter substrate-binding protein [Oligosphaera ethanolica]MDQ0291836.1 ribose transport system substrate-binding protein [Oligosphaera ethanolica]